MCHVDLMDHPMMTCPLDTPREQLNAYFEEFNRDLPESVPVDVKLKISSRLSRLLHHNYESDAAERHAKLSRLQALLELAQQEADEANEAADRLLEAVVRQICRGRLTEQEAAEAYGESPDVVFGPQPPRLLPAQVIDVAARLVATIGDSAEEAAELRMKPWLQGSRPRHVSDRPRRAEGAKAGAAARRPQKKNALPRAGKPKASS